MQNVAGSSQSTPYPHRASHRTLPCPGYSTKTAFLLHFSTCSNVSYSYMADRDTEFGTSRAYSSALRYGETFFRCSGFCKGLVLRAGLDLS